MGTGYSNNVKFVLEGKIEEDYEYGVDKNIEMCESELNLIAKRYGLDLFKQLENEE